MANTVTDDAMVALVGGGFTTGSLRDRQMAQHVAAGRTTGSYKDRCVVAGTPIFPKQVIVSFGAMDRMIVVGDHFVSEKIERIVLAIKDYEPCLEVKWLPPGERRVAGQDELLPAFEIVYHAENGQDQTLFYIKDEGDFDERVLQRIIINDQRKSSTTWTELSAWEETQKRIAKQAYLDELEEAEDLAKHILATHLNTYKVTPGLVIKDGIPFNAAHLKDQK